MLIIIGPSASGKTEAAKILEKKYGLKKVITHTTRNKRIGEIDDVDYHFIDKKLFLKLKNENFFVETMSYNDNFYGTSKKEISDNKCVVLDPSGAEAFYNLHDQRIYIVFFICSEDICKQRMINRLDQHDIILKRLKSDRLVFNEEKQKIANVLINSEYLSPEEIAKKIFTLYTDYLSTIK